MLSGAWGRVQNQAAAARLRAEAALLEREADQRRRQFGRDLYDLLAAQARLVAPGASVATAKPLREPYEQARADVAALQLDAARLTEQIELLQCNADRAAPAPGAKGQLMRAGRIVRDTGAEAKLQAELALAERRVRQRKEAFGIDVLALLGPPADAAAAAGGKGGGVPGTGILGSVAAKLSSREQEIQKCIERARYDVASILKRKEHKEREIAERTAGKWSS